ncbi:MAG: peptidyl-prolyl cis-trans isomerase [Deltaproteobacteria bacterium]|nr:peptidyl-prolyl cis-trans isomerase [Deltaproteobacteria bacterium]
MNKLIYQIIILLLLTVSTQARAETVDGIVAKVGSSVITKSDVASAVVAQRVFLELKFGSKQGLKEFQKFKNNILDELILNEILKDEVKRIGIKVTSKQINQEYRTRLERSGLSEPDFIKKLSRERVSLNHLKDLIKIDLEKQELISQKVVPRISISDYDLQKEYQKNLDKFKVFTKIRFIEVFLTQEKFSSETEMTRIAKMIQRRMQTNQTVSSMVKKYSSGAFAKNGGDSGLVKSDALRGEIQNILSSLDKGETSDLIPIENGVFVFKLLSKADPEPLPFNKVMPQLRMSFGQKVVNKELRNYLMAVKDRTYVEIVRP